VRRSAKRKTSMSVSRRNEWSRRTRAENIAKVRELLSVAPRMKEPENSQAPATDQACALPHPCPCCGGRMFHHRVLRTRLRAQAPAEFTPAGRQDRHIMMTRTAYDRRNSPLVRSRLSAGHAGAYPNLRNQHRSCMRLWRPTHSVGLRSPQSLLLSSTIAMVPRRCSQDLPAPQQASNRHR
jgi:hypothetical protein